MANNELCVSGSDYRALQGVKLLLQAAHSGGEIIVDEDSLMDTLTVVTLLSNPVLTVKDRGLIERYLNDDTSVLLVNKSDKEQEKYRRELVEETVRSAKEELRSLEKYGDYDSADTQLDSANYDGQVDGSNAVLSGRYKEDDSYYQEAIKSLADDTKQWEQLNGRTFNFYDEANKEFLPSDDVSLLVEIAYNQSYINAVELAVNTLEK